MRHKLLIAIGSLLLLAAIAYGTLAVQAIPATDSQAKEVFGEYLEGEYQVNLTKTNSHIIFRPNCEIIEAVKNTEEASLQFSNIADRLSNDGWEVNIFETNYGITQASISKLHINPFKPDLSGNITYDLNKIAFKITKNYKDCY